MSQPILISIPHQLGAGLAKTRIDEGFGRLEQQIGGGLAKVEKRWDGNVMTFSAKMLGQGLSGRMEVKDASVEMEIELPAILAAIANTIKGRLKTEGRLLLK